MMNHHKHYNKIKKLKLNINKNKKQQEILRNSFKIFILKILHDKVNQ